MHRPSIPLRPRLVTPPAAKPVSLEETKKACKIYHDDDDQTVTTYIGAAVRRLDGWGGILGRCMINQTWAFPARDWTCRSALIPFPDVSAVTVKYRDAADAEQTLDAGAFRRIEVATGVQLEWTAAFTSPALFDRSDAVTYEVVAGFGTAATDVPDEMRVAIIMTVNAWFYGLCDTDELPPAALGLIRNFRRNTL